MTEVGMLVHIAFWTSTIPMYLHYTLALRKAALTEMEAAAQQMTWAHATTEHVAALGERIVMLADRRSRAWLWPLDKIASWWRTVIEEAREYRMTVRVREAMVAQARAMTMAVQAQAVHEVVEAGMRKRLAEHEWDAQAALAEVERFEREVVITDPPTARMLAEGGLIKQVDELSFKIVDRRRPR